MARKAREVSVSAAGTLRLHELTGVVVYAPKNRRESTASGAYERLGKVRTAVFTPDGRQVAGVLVRRPDVAAMVKRPDVFCALDAIAPCDGGLRVTRGADAYDAAAQKRLGLDWDRCVIWEGMDARTTTGKVLGYVGDAEFDAMTGAVVSIGVGDGSVARSLVGLVEVPCEMVVGYEKGFLVVAPEAATLAASGGVAALAGEGYARAKIAGSEVRDKVRERGEVAVDAASEAVESGSKALGRQLGRTRGMFGNFVSEFKKASK